MTSRPRSFADLFVGTREIKEAYMIIGWIAVNHARLEQHLDYLIWQLEVFDFAGRRSHRDKSDAEVRELSKQLRHQLKIESSRVEDKLNRIYRHLTTERAAQRVAEIGQREHVLSEWSSLSDRIAALPERRNEVIHSAVSWSAGSTTGLLRKSDWHHDLPHLSLDLKRDEQLNSDIGAALTKLMEFTTTLTHLLPFKGDLTIISGVARI